MDKFKKVLEFKIKELKKDIAPREQEIMELGLGTQKMDLSLARYNTINNKLGFVVDEIRSKKLLMTDLNRKNRILIRKNDEHI